MRHVVAAALLAVLATGCAATPGDAGLPEREQSAGSAAAPSAPAAATAEESEGPSARAPGYPVERRIVGGPTDVNVDLATSFPKPDSLLPGVTISDWFAWKSTLYEETGLQLALSYQSLLQRATDVLPIADEKTAWGGWAQFEAKWEAINRGRDYEGGLAASLDWRHTIGGYANPTLFQVGAGSGWPTGFAFFDWDPSVTLFFWEQWLGKDKFELRIGKQLPVATFDFFRFKDTRTSFTGDPFTSTVATIPAPGFAQGVSFKWWPFDDPELSSVYVHGMLSDMNGSAEDFGLDTFVKGQYFYGLEIGYNWKREFPRDFDHAHLDLWYADERTEPDDIPLELPNEAGWGMKLAGSKQWGRWVTFGNYTFNTAEGGGFGLTIARHAVNAGAALLKPAGIRGEAAVGLSWMEPSPGALRNQYGGEVYWKILLTPDLWLTPGTQLVWNPALNPTTDFLGIFQIKFRLFF